MEPTDWTSIRVRRSTLEALDRARAGLAEAVSRGYVPGELGEATFSLDAWLAELARRVLAQRERVAKWQKQNR